MLPNQAQRPQLKPITIVDADGCMVMVDGQEFQLAPKQTAILTFEIPVARQSWLISITQGLLRLVSYH